MLHLLVKANKGLKILSNVVGCGWSNGIKIKDGQTIHR